MFTDMALMESMTPEQRLLFQSQYNATRKSAATGVVLALLLGGVGAHHFYLGRIGLGALYLLFCWTLIPALVALVEALLMKERVDTYNRTMAFDIAAQVKLFGSGPAVVK